MMNNNSDNSVNNNTPCNNNEIVFWKVIHNKYLFVKIIHSIENDSEHVSERIKFKHIYSLSWIIKNKQFQLLKCKLSNDKEYVEIDDFKGLLLSLHTSASTSVIDIELYKEILQLSIKRIKQSYQLSSVIDTLILFAFEYSSLQIINLIFQYLENGTTLESVLVNSYNSQRKTQFNLYLKLAASNKHDNHTLLNIMLDIIIEQRQQLQKHDKNTNDKPKQDDIELDFSNVLEIGNFNIQNKILDLEISDHSIYLLSDRLAELLENNNSNDVMELLLIGFRIIYKNQQQPQQIQSLQQQISIYKQGLNESLIFKELFKQFIILSNSTELFSIYLSKYNQVIKELLSVSEFLLIALEYSINHFIPDILNHFNVEDIFRYIECGYTPKEKSYVSNNLSRSIEFLKLYLSKLSTTITNNNKQLEGVVLENTIQIIYDIGFEIQDSLQYEQIVNNEIPDIYKLYLPLKWNPIVNQLNWSDDGDILPIIKDTETIDWMKQWFGKVYESGSSLFVDRLYDLLNFDNVELSLYAFNQLASFIETDEQSFYYTPFLKAIIEFDFQTIKYIHSLGITFLICEMKKNDFNQLLSYTTLGASIVNTTTGDINYQEINEITEYLIGWNTHQMIGSYSFSQLIDFIVENGYYNDSKYNNNSTNKSGIIKFDLEKVKINLVDQRSVVNHLQQVQNNYNYFRFLLENIKFTNQCLQNGIYRMKFNDQHKDKTNYIISLIQLFIVQLKQCREIIQKDNNNETQQELPNLRVYYRFLNSLFNSLAIDNDGLKLEEVHQVYQLLIENHVELVLEDELKLIYIKCRFPILYRYYKQISRFSYYQSLPLPSFELFKYESFDQLLELIIYRPYIDIQNEDYDNMDQEDDVYNNYNDNKFMGLNLIFFMEIKRMDLVIIEWELIKSTIKLVLPSFHLIRACCINLELNLIIDTLKEIENTFNTNLKSKLTLNEICSISLKLGTFEISKLALNTLIKYSNNNQIQVDDLIIKISNCDDDYILKNRYSIINILDKIN